MSRATDLSFVGCGGCLLRSDRRTATCAISQSSFKPFTGSCLQCPLSIRPGRNLPCQGNQSKVLQVYLRSTAAASSAATCRCSCGLPERRKHCELASDRSHCALGGGAGWASVVGAGKTPTGHLVSNTASRLGGRRGRSLQRRLSGLSPTWLPT